MTQTFPSNRDGPDNTPFPAQSLAQLDLDDLAQLCAQELHDLLASRDRAANSQEAFALELFRRAVAGSAPAWAHIFKQYTLPVTAWLSQFAEAGPVIDQLGVPAIVDAALMQFSQALTPDKLRQLPDHRALLRYLKMTLGSVVLDARRSLCAPAALATESGSSSLPPPFQRCGWQTSPTQQALLEAILAEMDSDDLRLVASLSFVQALSPETISSQLSARFPTVEDVYQSQRTILDRIRRSPGILDLLARLDHEDPARSEGSTGAD